MDRKPGKSTEPPWIPNDEEDLKRGVIKHGIRDWMMIATSALGGRRTAKECEDKWADMLKSGYLKGPWIKEEDDIVVKFVESYHGNSVKWSEISHVLPGRVGKQARERWCNHLDPELNKEPWSEAEDRLLVDKQSELGNRWSEIVKFLKGRSENTVKNRWNSRKRRLLKEKKIRDQEAMHKGASHAMDVIPVTDKLPVETYGGDDASYDDDSSSGYPEPEETGKGLRDIRPEISEIPDSQSGINLMSAFSNPPTIGLTEMQEGLAYEQVDDHIETDSALFSPIHPLPFPDISRMSAHHYYDPSITSSRSRTPLFRAEPLDAQFEGSSRSSSPYAPFSGGPPSSHGFGSRPDSAISGFARFDATGQAHL